MNLQDQTYAGKFFKFRCLLYDLIIIGLSNSRVRDCETECQWMTFYFWNQVYIFHVLKTDQLPRSEKKWIKFISMWHNFLFIREQHSLSLIWARNRRQWYYKAIDTLIRNLLANIEMPKHVHIAWLCIGLWFKYRLSDLNSQYQINLIQHKWLGYE